MVYEEVSPGAPERDDLRIAILTSLVANVFRGKGQRRYAPKDFMPCFEESRTVNVIEMKQTVNQVLDSVRRNKRKQ